MDKTRICIIGSITNDRLDDETVMQIIKSISVPDHFDLLTGSKKINRIDEKKAYVVLSLPAIMKNKISEWNGLAAYFPAWINEKGEFLVTPDIKKKLCENI